MFWHTPFLYLGEVKLGRELQIHQNKAAQIVCNAPARSNREKLLEITDWLSVNQMIVYYTAMAVFKVRRSAEPEYLAHFLKRDTRSYRNHRENARTSLASRSFVFRGAKLWNELPLDLRSADSTAFFKRALRKWVVDNVPQFPWSSW